MRRDWLIFIVVAIAVGLFVYGAIAWCLIAYRRRPGRSPEGFAKNTPLEILYVSIPLVLVVGLFALTVVLEYPVDTVNANPANRVAVTAFRWSWEFRYPGTQVVTTGTPAEPPTMYLPVGETTEIDLRSADVTHSFWVPAFLFKRDAIPGMRNTFDVTPTRTGAFLGRCAQFCGLDHALMTFRIEVVPAAAYDLYLTSHGAIVPRPS